jgi:hypothetical protein
MAHSTGLRWPTCGECISGAPSGTSHAFTVKMDLALDCPKQNMNVSFLSVDLNGSIKCSWMKFNFGHLNDLCRLS